MTTDQEIDSHTGSDSISLLPALILPLPIIIALICLGVYIFNFPGGLSGNQADWGTFGDFMGGVLNPIVSLVTLIALEPLTK
jgi:hypothetical protein